jgi:NAD(P)H dehydrogenase (quinone)
MRPQVEGEIMKPIKTVLAYGATGVQGAGTVRALARAGYTVRAVVRTKAAAERLLRPGVTPVIAKLEDPGSLDRASEGVDGVALVLPLEYDRKTAVRQGLNAIAAAEKAGVATIVFNTSTRIPSEATDVTGFEIKREVESALFASSVPAVSVRPTFYLENLLGPWTAPAIAKDSTIAYPIPARVRAAWLSVDDAGAFVASAFGKKVLVGRAIDIGGPEAVTGAELAEGFSSTLDRRVSYFPIPLDGFEAQLSAVVGPQAGNAITKMYRWMESAENTRLFHADAPALERDLGVRADGVRAWVAKNRGVFTPGT